jgi:hypothetical protein
MKCALDMAQRSGDMTFTGAALSYINNTVFSPANGARPYSSTSSKVFEFSCFFFSICLFKIFIRFFFFFLVGRLSF